MWLIENKPCSLALDHLVAGHACLAADEIVDGAAKDAAREEDQGNQISDSPVSLSEIKYNIRSQTNCAWQRAWDVKLQGRFTQCGQATGTIKHCLLHRRLHTRPHMFSSQAPPSSTKRFHIRSHPQRGYSPQYRGTNRKQTDRPFPVSTKRLQPALQGHKQKANRQTDHFQFPMAYVWLVRGGQNLGAQTSKGWGKILVRRLRGGGG